MTKDVIVSINGLQIARQNEESEPIEVITAGDYYKKNDKHYIIYDEVAEGFEGVTKNVVKLQENCMDITKRGITNVHMVFEKNKKHVTCYETPFGSLMLGIKAENDISVDVDYALELNDTHLADCKIKVAIQSRESGEFRILS